MQENGNVHNFGSHTSTYCRRGRCGPPRTRLLLETCQIRCTTMSHQCGASFQCVGLVVYSKTEGRVSQSRLSSHLHTRYGKSPAIFASGRSLTELPSVNFSLIRGSLDFAEFEINTYFELRCIERRCVLVNGIAWLILCGRCCSVAV